MNEVYMDDGGMSFVKPPCKECEFVCENGHCGLSDRDYDQCWQGGFSGFEPKGVLGQEGLTKK